MNCHELMAVAGDLARDQLMDANQREQALEHAASCAPCSTHLADQRELTAALRAMSRDVADQAPPRVEAAVLAAFREKPASVPSIAQHTQSTRWLFAVAAAAAIVIIVGMLAVLSNRSSNDKQQQASKEQTVKPEQPTPIPYVTPQAIPTPTPSVEPPSLATAERPRPLKKPKPRPQTSLATTTPNNKPTEIATEYIPLMDREAVNQMDGGQVMRVELPRSALMSFGLPMDMERATQRIKADVVVGNDGLARAIRFVR